jgi:tetratricopeptide (TPR) repeat protein
MKPLMPSFLVLLALAVPPTYAQAPAQAPKMAPPSPQTQQTIQSAIQKYKAGDVKGAIAVLEPLRGKPGTHPAALSLLGTLYLEDDRPKDALAILGPIADGGAAGPMILHNAGRAALALKQTAKAEKYLRAAMEKAPDSAAVRDLGLLLGGEGLIEDSYVLLRPWSLAHPDDGETRLSAAYAAVELDRTPEAAELLRGLPEDDPRVRLLRARVQLLQQKPQDALTTLQPLTRNAPPDLDLSVRRYLAEAYLALGKSGEAIPLLRGKVGDDPSMALLLGRAEYRDGHPEEAVAVLEPLARNLLAGEPASPAERRILVDLAVQYGQALVGTSKWNDAIPPLTRATQLDPNSILAWQFLARAQLAAGQRDDANKSLEKFRQIESSQKSNTEQSNETERSVADPTRRNLEEATKLATAGHTEQALAMIRKEAALQPKDPRPRAQEIAVLIAAKRTQEALKAAEATLSTSPGNPDFLYLRGATKMASQDLPGAEQDFRQVLKIKPDHVAAMSDLAVLLTAGGKKDEARQLLQKVLQIRPGDPAATANLKSLGPS